MMEQNVERTEMSFFFPPSYFYESNKKKRQETLPHWPVSHTPPSFSRSLG